FERLRSWIVANEPPITDTVLVHGDYGLHNARVESDGNVRAIVDWEISTLGDPLVDLAYFLDKWVRDPDELGAAPNEVTALPGFSSREEIVSTYRAVSRREVTALPYYRCFNRWRRAAILRGVHDRYAAGQKAGENVDLQL